MDIRVVLPCHQQQAAPVRVPWNPSVQRPRALTDRTCVACGARWAVEVEYLRLNSDFEPLFEVAYRRVDMR